MKHLLALVLCASSLSLFASALPKDTVDKYVIDNVVIDKFNGSQLVGKSILNYQITCMDAGKTVERRHVISTNVMDAYLTARVLRGNDPFAYMTNGRIVEVDTNSLITNSLIREQIRNIDFIRNPRLSIVDGKEMPLGYKISQSQVARVVFHKPGSAVAKSYGEKGKNGVQMITTWEGKKKEKTVEVAVAEETGLTTDYKGLIIVDGKEIKNSDLDRIKKNNTTSAYMLAPGSKGAESYGEKGKNGVMIITTIKATEGKTAKVVYIDGQKVDESEMNKLSPSNISGISLVKSKKGEPSVIYIETKRGKKEK